MCGCTSDSNTIVKTSKPQRNRTEPSNPIINTGNKKRSNFIKPYKVKFK